MHSNNHPSRHRLIYMNGNKEMGTCSYHGEYPFCNRAVILTTIIHREHFINLFLKNLGAKEWHSQKNLIIPFLPTVRPRRLLTPLHLSAPPLCASSHHFFPKIVPVVLLQKAAQSFWAFFDVAHPLDLLSCPDPFEFVPRNHLRYISHHSNIHNILHFAQNNNTHLLPVEL